MVLIYALANYMQSLFFFVDRFSSWIEWAGLRFHPNCVNGTAVDIYVNFFPLETNSIQNQRITKC